MASPNMNLPIPDIGITDGPAWAQALNDCLDIIDMHDHTPGYGVPVSSDGINISSDLSFNGYNIIDSRSVRLENQTIAFTSPDIGCIYELNGELHYIDSLGQDVQITNNGSVAGATGTIANLVSPASATYVGADSKFVWQSNSNTSAIMDFSSAYLRNLSAGSFGLHLQPPAAMGADFDIILPTPPGSGSRFVSLDSSGNMGAVWNVDNVTLQISANVLQVPSSVNLPGKAVKESGSNIVVSNGNAATSLAILRGWIGSAGEIYQGEGFSVNVINTGKYQINFNSAYASVPIFTGTAWDVGQALSVTFVSTGPGAPAVNQIQYEVFNAAGTATNANVMFIIIGPRA